MRFEGKVALITGGATGIGQAIAARLALEGAAVVIADIDDTKGAATAAEFAAAGHRAEYVHLDVTDVEMIRAVVGSVAKEHGALDVMVNNAGRTKDLRSDDVEEDDWEMLMAVNAKGMLFGQQAAARQMIKQGHGAIVNLSSIAGKGWPTSSNIVYASAKGAVLTMTRRAAAELAPHGVRVNSICPGITDTALFRGQIAELAEREEISPEAVLDRYYDYIPMRRLSLPDDIAAAAAFLASDDARVITGQSINVDGGILTD